MAAVIERTRATMSEKERADEKKAHFVKAKAAELQIVTNLDSLRTPTIEFRAQAM